MQNTFLERRKMNALIILLVGLGMPAYYKIKFLMLGVVEFEDIFNWTIFAEIFFGCSLAAAVIFAHDRLVKFLRRQFSEKSQNSKRLVIQLVVTSILSVVVAVLYSILFWDVIMKMPITEEYLFDYALLGLFIPLLVNGITETFYFYGEWEKERVIKIELEKEHIKAKYEALQNQVDPHFFFNCFHTLAVLIDESKKLALNFLQQLARVYRYILEIKDNELIPLQKELQALDSYIALMKYRFGEAFYFDNTLNLEDQKNFLIAPLTLQILMENALKHNIVSDDSPMQITLELDDRERLLFRNSKRKKENVVSTHTGLANLTNRYRYLVDEKVEVQDGDQNFMVAIPLIHISPL